MFRESNAQERHLHASYTTKPSPALQQLSQVSRLDDSATHAKISNCDVFSIPAPAAVPVTYDTVYDPSHPDADWSGMVSLKNQHKKHMQGHASQKLGIEQCEHGIVAKVERQEWGHRRQPEGHSKNSSQLVLSGVGGDNNADRFKSEYNRFAEHEGTQRDQLVLEKRLKSIKRIPDPAQARSASSRMQSTATNGYGGDYTPRSQMGMTYGDDSARQGYEGSVSANSPYGPSPANPNGNGPSSRIAPASLYGKKSFISDIASSISSKVEAPSRAVSNTDSAFSHNRTLVTDNYKPFPGYTGHRKG